MHSSPLPRFAIFVFLLAFAATAVTGGTTDWPHLRGPAFDGRIDAGGAFDGDAIGLEVAWTAPIGSAYSGVVIADGVAVTAFAEGESDWVAAFNSEDGRPLWRRVLGPISRGHDGSHDGPLSSPVVAGGRVFALASTGELRALRLFDGEPLWQKSLGGAFGAEAPPFGFTSTPVLSGDVLILLAGGKDGHLIVGLDAATGNLRWKHGDDKVDYQSPTVMTLAGRPQVVAVSQTRLTGLAPDTGKLLWEQELEETRRAGSATPTPLGNDRFLYLSRSGAVVMQVASVDDVFAVQEVFASEALGNSYAQPVLHDGYLYGFRGQVLTCVDAATGERVWRSRPPGGDGLILVDGHLVVFGTKGHVVVVEASPEGYREVARLQALDGSSLTWPSYADGRIYVRNLDTLAAVSVTRSAAAPVAVEAAEGHAFARWVESVEASDDPRPLVDRLFEEHAEFPIVEGEWTHFVYRGAAKDVSIAGSMNDTEAPEQMRRVAGTDLYWRSYRLKPGTRWEYRFQVDYEDWIRDPRNAREVPAIDGDDLFSELILPGYEVAGHLAPHEGRSGRIEELTLASAALGYEKKVSVWLPPGYDDGDRAYPLLVVTDGESWMTKGLLPRTLDNLVGRRVEPVVVAFVDSHPRWWLESGGGKTDEFVRMIGEELVPKLAQTYRLVDTPGAHGLLGNRFYAFSSAYAALRYPAIFGKVAVQSIYTKLGHGDDLAARVGEADAPKVRFYLDWNRWDVRNIDRDWDFARDSREFAALLHKHGYVVEGGEVADSYGWGGWRNRADRLLVSLFPATVSESGGTAR